MRVSKLCLGITHCEADSASWSVQSPIDSKSKHHSVIQGTKRSPLTTPAVGAGL